MKLLASLALGVAVCMQPVPERPCRYVDKNGKEVRSYAAKMDFIECVTGERRSKAGHYVEHIIPLHCGGSDRAANMALVPISMWDWKRRWEIKDCKQTREFMLALGLGEACYEE